MKRIAVIIGVGNYPEGTTDLPACTTDAKAIKSLLDSSDSYDEIFFRNGEVKSAKFKEEIIDFFQQLDPKSISEVFFFFSGHGYISDSKFYYVFSDFDTNRVNTTGFDNEELDQLVRSVSPQNFIKVVDACHSGQRYIKDIGDNFLKNVVTSPSLENLYFMFSSDTDEASYCDSNISFFTNSFLQAVHDFQNGSIRYKDIVDYITDHFSYMKMQTPFFVTQANNTQKFVSVNKKIRDSIKDFIVNTNHTNDKIESEENKTSKLERLINFSQQLKSKDNIEATYDDFLSLEIGFNIDSEINGSYNFEYQILNEGSDFPDSAIIGRWIKEFDNYPSLLAKEHYSTRTVQRRVPKRSEIISALPLLTRNFMASNLKDDETKFVTEQERYIESFNLLDIEKAPGLKIISKPNNDILYDFEFYQILILSRMQNFCFYKMRSYETTGFDSRMMINQNDWQHFEFNELTYVKEALQTYFTNFAKQEIENLHDKTFRTLAPPPPPNPKK